MRSTRRSGGDNGYRTAEDFSNEGRGYERPNSYSDRYRYERDDTDYRGQGNDQNDGLNSGRQNNYYGNNNNRIENTGRSREWTNHQSGWNDNGSNWGNRGMQDNNRYSNDGSYRSSGNRDSSGYGRSAEGAPRSLNNNDDYRFENRRYPQNEGYSDWQNRNRGNESHYNSQNDFLEDEEDDYGDRMTNRNGYNDNPNNDYRRSATRNNYGSSSDYGNLWNRDNRQDNNASRRSRQGFGSMSKERRQEVASQGGRASHENR